MRRLVAAGLLLAACGDFEDPSVERWALLPPVALQSRAAFVERTNARVFLLDPANPELATAVVPVTKDPVLAVRRNGQGTVKDELLVLCRGERGAPGVRPEPPALVVVAADGTTRTLPLAARFNALAQSSDGRFLVLHFGKSAMGETLFNPNEIAVVDLEAPAPAAVPRTIRSFGGVPSAVIFSPQLPLPDGPRTLAVILSDNYVTLVDLDNPMRPETTVPLTLPEDRRTVRPLQVLFDDKDPTVFVRADGSNDIHALRLQEVPAAERPAGGNDFRPALGQLAAGTKPQDMALFDAREGRRLLVVSSSGDAFVIDARTSRTTRLPLDGPANRIGVFEATGPGDPKSRLRALLLGAGVDTSLVGFLDLDGVEEQRGRNLDSRTMGAPAQEALFFADRQQVVVQHRTQPGLAGLSVIDLSRRTVAPIFAEAPLARVALGPTGSDKIWIPPTQGERLGFLSLATLQPGEVRLDARISDVLPIGAKHVVVVHPGAGGRVTVLDAAKPERATARAAAGFLLTHLFERGDR